tara:strand:- start:408 stop:1004 length:597 start_codon:yes stop_codon:yes gene_type:complete
MVLAIKGIKYEHDEVSPFEIDEQYRRNIHPMGKVPAYEEDGWILPDSSAICSYLDNALASPGLIYGNARDKAQIIWWEEFLDTAFMQKLAGPFFFENVVKPRFLKQATDKHLLDMVDKYSANEVLSVLDRQLQNDKYIYGNQLSLADVTFAAHFRAAYLGGFQLAGRGFDRVESLWKLLQKTSGIQDIIADENKYLAG